MRDETARETGFTLLEIVVVIAIMGVLATIALPRYQNYVEKVHAAHCLLLRRNIETLTQAYFFENEVFIKDYIGIEKCPRDGVYTWNIGSSDTPEYGQVQCSLHHIVSGGNVLQVPTGDNLTQNSNFALSDRKVKRWAPVKTGQIPGWDSNTGAIEMWADGFLGYKSPSGGYIVELDGGRAHDTISQEIDTEAGRIYEVKVMARARTANSSDFSIGWGGEQQESYSPPTNGWQEYTIKVVGTGGPVSLSLSESANQSNGLGTLIDSVEVIATDAFE